MSYSFDARHGLIILLAELFGTSGSIIVRLALDTGATRTTINVGLLTTIGYDQLRPFVSSGPHSNDHWQRG